MQYSDISERSSRQCEFLFRCVQMTLALEELFSRFGDMRNIEKAAILMQTCLTDLSAEVAKKLLTEDEAISIEERLGELKDHTNVLRRLYLPVSSTPP